MLLQQQTAMMTRHKSERVIEGMKVFCKGRGLNDAKIPRMRVKLQEMLKGAMEDAAVTLKEDVNNLVWRIDYNGCIHITDTRIKVQ